MSDPAPLVVAHPQRATLNTHDNPHRRRDYRVTVQTVWPRLWQGRDVHMTLDYIPHKLCLDETCLAAYAAALGTQTIDRFEALANLVLDDVNNEVIPRFARLRLVTTDAPRKLEVVIQDRQPGWSNAELE